MKNWKNILQQYTWINYLIKWVTHRATRTSRKSEATNTCLFDDFYVFLFQSFSHFGNLGPGPSRWDGDEDPGKIRFIVPKFWEKNRMRSATQPYCNNGWIRLCFTAHAIFFPKFWNDKTNFTRVFVTVSPRRPWDRGCHFGWFWNPGHLDVDT